MSEFIDPTWIVARFERGERSAAFHEALERIAGHYAPAYRGKLEIRGWASSHCAVAVVGAASAARWPAWAEDPRTAVASAYVPLDWQGLTGVAEPAKAVLPLAGALLEAPERAARELAAPCVLALVDKPAERITIVNDALGAGRLFEADADGAQVWSNRLGALCLAAEVPARADEEAWSLFAAFGWFPRGRTAVRGATPVAGGTILEICRERVTRRSSSAIAELVSAGEGTLGEATEAFAADAVARARALERLYPDPARVDLSGGRDSRVTAAAVVAAGIDASFRTSDLTPGEADVARDLIARVPAELDHVIQWGGSQRKSPPGSPLDRAAAVHLVHDGMRHAAKVRGKMTLPRPQPGTATVSGHGGAIAKGPMYSGGKLARIEAGGFDGLIEVVLRSVRRAHGAATAETYELSREQIADDLRLGQRYGVTGPSLLDWYYLVERFARRTALAADVSAFTFFSSPAFIRAAFRMEPRQRLESKLHLDAVRLLVPSWAEVPFFQRERARRGPLARLLRRGGVRRVDQRREPIWSGHSGDEVRSLVAGRGTWTTMFDAARVDGIVAEIDAGQAHPHYQDVLEAIVYRSAFDAHLERLDTAARSSR